MLDQIVQAGRYLGQSVRLMVGLPEYDTYVAHRESSHPGQPMMSYEEFFRERQEARYGGGESRRICRHHERLTTLPEARRRLGCRAISRRLG